jgi:hypothetical protein
VVESGFQSALGGKGQTKILKTDTELDQAIVELIRLHDDVLARLFSIQTLLQDLDLILPEEIQRRTEQFRKRFAADLDARFAAHQAAAGIHLVPDVDTKSQSSRREIEPSSTETELGSKCNAQRKGLGTNLDLD